MMDEDNKSNRSHELTLAGLGALDIELLFLFSDALLHFGLHSRMSVASLLLGCRLDWDGILALVPALDNFFQDLRIGFFLFDDASLLLDDFIFLILGLGVVVVVIDLLVSGRDISVRMGRVDIFERMVVRVGIGVSDCI